MPLQQQEIEQLINNCKGSIVVTTHHKPDADALGSSLGLMLWLKAMGKDAVVITPTDFPKFLDWMPQRDGVVIFEEEEEKAKKLTQAAALIFCLDFNDLRRINEYGIIVENAKATKIMIDHHQEPKAFAALQYHTVETSSTCQLVFEFIKNSSNYKLMDKNISSCLYAGIMTDTGGFRHGNTTSQTFRAAADLLDFGIDNVGINQEILDQHTLKRFRLIGFSLNEKLRLICDDKVAVLTLSAAELEKHKVQTGDTEGLVNYGLSIAGVGLSVLIVDRTIRVKMSFRSRNRFPCNIFAKENFDGGGHYNAAGGQSELSLDETIVKFETKIKNYLQWLD